MKTKVIAIGTGIFGVLAGFLLSSSVSKNDIAKIATIATLITAPTGIIAHTIGENKGNKRFNELEDKFSTVEKNFNKVENECKSDLERLNRLNKELTKIREVLNKTTLERDTYFSIAESAKPAVDILQQKFENSLKSISEWEIKYLELQEKCDSMEEIFDSELENQVEQELNRKLEVLRKSEIKQVCSENDSITDESMALVRRMRDWALKVSQSHDAKKEFVHQLTEVYNGNLDKVVGKIDEINQSFDKERDGYLTQIDCLNERIARLQNELKGVMIEPAYFECGYNVSGRIGNSIAQVVWNELEVPLAVKGFYETPEGVVNVGYAYSHSTTPESIVEALRGQSENICKILGIYKITNVRKHEISELIVLTFRRESPVKENTIKDLVSSSQEFINYVTSNPIRYRLIADPGFGKTPSTAVMISEILKVGCTRGNTGKGSKISHTLVTVSCPDVLSSQKDFDYSLKPFLKYGDSTAAVKSFNDAFEDWEYRKSNTKYAEKYFGLWVWDELDNSINLADNPKELGETFKAFLKQAHHTGMGWIVSGQSVMTSQIPGFKNDDRTLFTEIIIGVKKIRLYLENYGNKVLNKSVVSQLLRNLEILETYQEDKNTSITDEAKKYRLALVLDDKSPKMYWLPNLDLARFDTDQIEILNNQARLEKAGILSNKNGKKKEIEAQNAYETRIPSIPGNSTILVKGEKGESMENVTKPYCLHCDSDNLRYYEKENRYHCRGCNKKFVFKKAVWK